LVTAREAKQGFSHILKQAERGESVVITRRGFSGSYVDFLSSGCFTGTGIGDRAHRRFDA
jgi:hypothetical protein